MRLSATRGGGWPADDGSGGSQKRRQRSIPAEAMGLRPECPLLRCPQARLIRIQLRLITMLALVLGGACSPRSADIDAGIDAGLDGGDSGLSRCPEVLA